MVLLMLNLALKKITHHKYLSLIISLTIALSFIIFLVLSSVLENYAERITDRTRGDLIVAGRKGANVDLIMDALYFRQGSHNFIKQGSVNEIRKDSLTAGMFNLYSVKGYPMVGVDIEYFEMRNLAFKDGSFFTQLGECVIGSEVAQKLNLKVNDTIISDPKNIFDPAGSTPLKLTISGILKKTDSPDDTSFFTSLKTGWTAHGIGHSHAPETDSPDLSIKVIEFTPETLKTFHFHGDEKDFPLTAALILPKDEKQASMLIAKTNSHSDIHIILPERGLKSFLNMIFQMNQLFSMILILVLVLLVIFFGMLLYLQIKLRQKERILWDRLGAENTFFYRLMCAEWSILTACGLGIGYISSMILKPFIIQLFDQITKG